MRPTLVGTFCRIGLPSLWIVGALLSLAACQDDVAPTAPPNRSIATSAGSPGPLAPPSNIDSDLDGITDTKEETLARQFRPFWDHDNQESWFPISLDEWGAIGRYVGVPSNSYNSITTLHNAAVARPNDDMFTSDGIYAGFVICNDTFPSWNRRPGCNDAPTFVEAFPVQGSRFSKTNLVWIQYWLFYQSSASDGGPFGPPFNFWAHYGDWEHICVLTSLDDLGVKTASPIELHFHAHGGNHRTTSFASHSDRRCTQYGLTHSECYGTKHPRVYVQAWGHASYSTPGSGADGPHNGGYRFNDDQLNNPLIFLTNHRLSNFNTYDMMARFNGQWGNSSGSPIGPLEWNGPCDHDYHRLFGTVYVGNWTSC